MFIKLLLATFLFASVVVFKSCNAAAPKTKCLFRVIEEDGSKYTYDFSGHDYDMVYDSDGFEIIMNLCNTAAKPCYPSTCYNTGNVLHSWAGKPCLPWNATANTGNILFFSTQPGGPPDTAGTNYPTANCPTDYEPAKQFGCEQQQCYSAAGKKEHCTKACAVVSNTQPEVHLQYPNKTAEGLQFTWDIVPNSDDLRNPIACQGGGGFSATATIDCDPKADITSLTIDSVSKISCNFNIKLRSKAACKAQPFVPIPAVNNDDHPWGWFSIFCFTLFMLFITYFIIGTIYMYKTKGYCEIPHKFFWERCMFSCKTSCMSLCDRCGSGGVSSSGSGTSSGKSVYNEFGSSSGVSSSGTRLSNTYNPSRAENTVVYDDL